MSTMLLKGKRIILIIREKLPPLLCLRLKFEQLFFMIFAQLFYTNEITNILINMIYQIGLSVVDIAM